MISNDEKKLIAETFVETLPVLRAAIGASQADVASAIGISRQTYCALEQKKRPRSSRFQMQPTCMLSGTLVNFSWMSTSLPLAAK